MSNTTSSGGYPVTGIHRWMLVGWSLFLMGGFLLAMKLEPDPSGFGTHQSLGLPPCAFRALTNYPCPGCGMTTSFAHMVRGNFVSALRANLAGVLLAVVCVCQIPWCLWSAARGRLIGIIDPLRSFVVLVCVLGGMCVLNWGIRLISG
jgi:Protein of unknown function (DUF2752)